MMNVRVLVLAVLVAATGGVAYFLNSDKDERESLSKSGQSAEAAAQSPLPGLATAAPEVDHIRVENAGGVVFEAKRQGGSWHATHLDSQLSFPVDTEALSTLLSDLSQARILEQKTSKPENYPKLGVEALDHSDAQSALVTLETQNKGWQLLVGNTASNGMGSYARLPDQAASLLLDTVLTMPGSASDWLAQQILPFTADDVEAVTVRFEDNPPLTLQRQQDNPDNWQLLGLGEEESLTFPGTLAQTVADMVDLRFQDLLPYRQHEWEALRLIGDVGFTLVDGSEVFAYLSEADDSGSHKIWFSTPDSPNWISDWVLVLSDFQAQPYQTQRDDLVRSEDSL